MTNFGKVWTIIPCYNEEYSIASVVKDFSRQGLTNFILVDDGSLDSTLDVLNQIKNNYSHLNVYVLTKPNQGQGSALSYGLDYLLDLNLKFDYVIFADADGQHSGADAKNLVISLHNSNNLIAHGTRFFNENTPYYKHLTNFLVSISYKAIFGKVIPDAACGLRAYNSGIVKHIKLSAGAAYIIEANALELSNWENVDFVPISAIYSNYSLNKGLTWQGGVKIVIHMLKLRITSATSKIFIFTKKAVNAT